LFSKKVDVKSDMGAYLSEPVIEKFSKDCSNQFLNYGASSMQGWRTSQEV
jgi:AGAP006171-PA